jgi:hemerythrin-like domain-containing protein
MIRPARKWFDAPATFDDPFEMLLACHERIEKQLETLKRLRAHVDSKGAVDAEASVAAQSVLRYFREAAPRHHADEEVDLFPLLESRIADGAEAARFRALRDSLAADHRRLEDAWARLRKPLEAIGEGLARTLPPEEVRDFTDSYARHIHTEETILRAFFDRWLDEGDRVRLGRAMAARRGAAQPRG